MTDTESFKLGENIASTPGDVVFRNDLMELIQYLPTTEAVYSVPLLFAQPWINKFYILDLGQEKSLVRYLLDQGFTVFMVSWKNPTSEMRDTTFEDYVFKGVFKAVEVAKEISGADHVHAVGYCVGGAALASLLAWLSRDPKKAKSMPIKDWTLFATLVDYSNPGDLGVFITEGSIRRVEQAMEEEGYIDGKHLSLAFRLLRADSLIWWYYAHSYLRGEMPPKSDFLYWNGDSTRLPAAMASFYLREFYLNNNLIKKDKVILKGRPLDLGRIKQPLYTVGSLQDHICPWQETFKIGKLVGGPVRYALAEEGHITGIVNPPSARNKKKYWAGEISEPYDPSVWLSEQTGQQGSWWVDWIAWLSERCGSLKEPPPVGGGKYPSLEKAPGSYVME